MRDCEPAPAQVEFQRNLKMDEKALQG